MFDVAMWGLLAAIVLVLGFSEPVMALMAPMRLGQHRSLVPLHRRWHAGQFVADGAVR